MARGDGATMPELDGASLDAALDGSLPPPPPTPPFPPPPPADSGTALDGSPAAGDADTRIDAGPAPPPPPRDAGPMCVPAAETCNGRDDDCDGLTDEELGGAACDTAMAMGQCRFGSTACEDATLVCLPSAPIAETCVCQDRDCNGVIDDGCRVPIHRSYSEAARDHLLSRTEGEGDAIGYVREGAVFTLYSAPSTAMTLASFYRFFGGGKHFASTDSDPGGCVSIGGCSLEGTLGLIATSPTCGSVPLTEGRHTNGDRVYTADPAEAAGLPGLGFATRIVGHVWR